MKKVLIVFWSGTGNTETMAHSVAKGVKEAGGEAVLKPAAQASNALVKEADALAFGCPAMGDEVLEEGEMEPFVSGLSASDLGDKPLALFGSYDWGDGLWMRTWVDRMKNLNARLEGEGLIAHLEPDGDVIAKCIELGKKLAS